MREPHVRWCGRGGRKPPYPITVFFKIFGKLSLDILFLILDLVLEINLNNSSNVTYIFMLKRVIKLLYVIKNHTIFPPSKLATRWTAAFHRISLCKGVHL